MLHRGNGHPHSCSKHTSPNYEGANEGTDQCSNHEDADSRSHERGGHVRTVERTNHNYPDTLAYPVAHAHPHRQAGMSRPTPARLIT